MTVSGASRTVLDIRVPYANASLAGVLGHVPTNYASQDTAASMAQAAYRNAANLSPFGTQILGVSCTCALITDRVKKGNHKVCHPSLRLSCTASDSHTLPPVLQL